MASAPRQFSHIHSRNPCKGQRRRSIDQAAPLPYPVLPLVLEEILGREQGAPISEQKEPRGVDLGEIALIPLRDHVGGAYIAVCRPARCVAPYPISFRRIELCASLERTTGIEPRSRS